MKLANPMLGIFLRAVTDSFDPEDLEQILLERLNLRYKLVTNPRSQWRTQVLDVHKYFDMRNETEKLVSALRDMRPNVPELALVADEMGFTSVSRTELEVLVQHQDTPFQDVETFRANLSMIEAATCQIDTGGSLGTGILIADDMVITNHHVVAGRLDGATTLTGPVSCRFDYKTNGSFTTPPVVVAVKQVMASSPHAAEDVTAGPMTTNRAALDYAILKLERDVAREPLIATGVERGHVDIGATPLAQDDAGVLVLQHPGGKPMKIDLGSITDVGDVRFRHSVNTEPGSSGAPVFDAALRMIGIHHAGHRNGPGAALPYNEAIPLGVILADARQKGVVI